MSKQTTGEFMATLRKANGYTQADVAEKLNISNRTLSSWETDRTLPDVLMLPAIADLYGVTVDELLHRHYGKFLKKYLQKQVRRILLQTRTTVGYCVDMRRRLYRRMCAVLVDKRCSGMVSMDDACIERRRLVRVHCGISLLLQQYKAIRRRSSRRRLNRRQKSVYYGINWKASCLYVRYRLQSLQQSCL